MKNKKKSQTFPKTIKKRKTNEPIKLEELEEKKKDGESLAIIIEQSKQQINKSQKIIINRSEQELKENIRKLREKLLAEISVEQKEKIELECQELQNQVQLLKDFRRKEDEIQRKEAEIQRKEAEIQRKEAEVQRKEAEIQRKEAEIQRIEDDIQRIEDDLRKYRNKLLDETSDVNRATIENWCQELDKEAGLLGMDVKKFKAEKNQWEIEMEELQKELKLLEDNLILLQDALDFDTSQLRKPNQECNLFETNLPDIENAHEKLTNFWTKWKEFDNNNPETDSNVCSNIFGVGKLVDEKFQRVLGSEMSGKFLEILSKNVGNEEKPRNNELQTFLKDFEMEAENSQNDLEVLEKWLLKQQSANRFVAWARNFLLCQINLMMCPRCPLEQNQSEHLTSGLFDTPFFFHENLNLVKGETQIVATGKRIEKSDPERNKTNAKKADGKIETSFRVGSARLELAVFENKKENAPDSSKINDDLWKIQREMKDMLDEIKERFSGIALQKKLALRTFGILCAGFHIQFLELDQPFKQVYRVRVVESFNLPNNKNLIVSYASTIWKVYCMYDKINQLTKLIMDLNREKNQESTDDHDPKKPINKGNKDEEKGGDNTGNRRLSFAATKRTPKKSGKRQTADRSKQTKGYHIFELVYTPKGHSSWIARGYHVDNSSEDLIFKLFRLWEPHQKECFLHRLATKLKIPYVAPVLDTFKLDCPQFGKVALVLPKLFPFANQDVSFVQLKKWMYQLLIALERLHQHEIMHLDIKPANVMLNSVGDLQLIDFSCADWWKVKQRNTGAVGTPGFISPEVEQNNGLIESTLTSSDVWSSGVTFLCWLCPFMPLSFQKIYFRCGSVNQPENTQNAIRMLQECLSYSDKSHQANKALDLIQKMMILNPLDRWTTTQCLSHPFFSSGPSVTSEKNQNVRTKDEKRIPNKENLKNFRI